MTFFVVYDPRTGAIQRSGFCSAAATLPRQAKSGEAVLAADRVYPGDAYAVDITKKPPALVAKPA